MASPVQAAPTPAAAPFAFPESAPSANPVFSRTYSRRLPSGLRETFPEVVDRNLAALVELGKLTYEQAELLRRKQLACHSLPSGRWLWVGGTPWLYNPANYSGAYNCTSTNLTDLRAFGLMMDLAMMGSGTGAVIESHLVEQLPSMAARLNIKRVTEIGTTWRPDAVADQSQTLLVPMNQASPDGDSADIVIRVGDSRRGWVDAYQALLTLAATPPDGGVPSITQWNLSIDLSCVRPAGTPLRGFGGRANPSKLPELFHRCVAILNRAQGRKLTSLECCLLIDEAALVVVAGNIRRSAGMRQFAYHDDVANNAKANLWRQDEEGHWVIDPERDALRMANHTRVAHTKPSYEDILSAVRKQFHSGEGAIQYAPEAIWRANIDILRMYKAEFISLYCNKGPEAVKRWIRKLHPEMPERELDHRLQRYGLNPCFAPGTMVMTRQGHFPIESLVGKTVDIFDGEQWVTINNFRVTGTDQPVLKVQLHSGVTYTVTPYHKFVLASGDTVEAQNLVAGNELLSTGVGVEGTVAAKGAYLKGFLIADGTYDSKNDIPICKVYQPKHCCVARLVAAQQEIGVRELVAANGRRVGHETGLTDGGYLRNLNTSLTEDIASWCSVYKHEFPVEVFNWTRTAQLDLIAGLFDGDGTVKDTKHGFAYQLTSVSREFLEGLVQLLHTLGVCSKIGPVRKGGTKDFGPHRGGIYSCQDTYRLNISQANSIKLARMVKFERLKSFAEREARYQVKDRSFRVVSVEPAGSVPAVYCCTVPTNHRFTLTSGAITGQCGEILGADFYCNLGEVHLNLIEPRDWILQLEAFQSAALSVASLLNHNFTEERYRYSREIDPIVGVSFTGLFDFFVRAFGTPWLYWWAAGRPDTDEGRRFRLQEEAYLCSWRATVRNTIEDYCHEHGLRMPNRYTTVQPAGTKSLLTGASPGWHPPKAQRFIRRITFGKDDPVALACMDFGYTVVPSQSDKDENGRLLTDPFDPRCSEWLVEIPTEVPWANLPGADEIDISAFSATAQFDFYMQVQKHYTTHNTSATIEFREAEIEPLAQAIHASIQSDSGYISAALLARFDANETFPRMPFEPISKDRYDELHAAVLQRRKNENFAELLTQRDAELEEEANLQGPAGCDGDKCLMPLAPPQGAER